MIVRVTCPACSDVAVVVHEVLVVRIPGQSDLFRFDCPRCGREVEKKAVGRVPELLLAAGAGLVEPPPLSLDDLAELRRDLDADDWLDRLLA
jgi:hypothetical protein